MDIRAFRKVIKEVFKSKLETDKDILQCIEDMGYAEDIKRFSKEQVGVLLKSIKDIACPSKDPEKVAIFLASGEKGSRICACISDASKQTEDFYDNLFSLGNMCKAFPIDGCLNDNMLDLIKSAKLSVGVALNLYEDRNKDKSNAQ